MIVNLQTCKIIKTVFGILFILFQFIGIITAIVGAAHNRMDVVWVGIGFIIAGFLLAIGEKINSFLMEEYIFNENIINNRKKTTPPVAAPAVAAPTHAS